MPELPEVEVVRRGLETPRARPPDHRGRGAAPAPGPAPRRRPGRLRRPADRPHVHRRPPPRQVPLAPPRQRRRPARPPRDERPDAGAAARRTRREAPAGPVRARPTTGRAAVRRPADVRRAGGLRRGRRACPRRSRTSPATRSTRSSTTPRSYAACGAASPGSSGCCSTRTWSPASATSTPTRGCGWPGCTASGRARGCAGADVERVLAGCRQVMLAGARPGRHLLRRALRQRQRPERLLRPLAGGLRARGRALLALRYADPAGHLHEPLVVLLPGLPAGPAAGAGRPPAARRP